MKLSKIFVASALALSMLSSTALATAPVTSFSDIPTSHWGHTEIMKAVDKGLFSGTTTPVNGVGTFEPAAPMTRAMFLVVVNRALGLPTEEIPGANWADGGINSLIQNGVIKDDDFNKAYSSPMTRQEMAYVLGSAMQYTGETLNANIGMQRIPDYSEIHDNYTDEVIIAYSNGLIAGTDDKGTFKPEETLNRAQAATVLIRLVDKSSRKAPLSDAEYDAVTKPVESTPVVTNPVHEHTWVESIVHHEGRGHYGMTYEERIVIRCGCGEIFYDQASFDAHGPEGPKGWDGCMMNSSVGPEKFETGIQWIVDGDPWDEVIGYKCECGATYTPEWDDIMGHECRCGAIDSLH